MCSLKRFTVQEKLGIVQEYKKGKYSMKELSELKNVSICSISRWVNIYKVKGVEGLINKPPFGKRIPEDVKRKIVNDYNNGNYSTMDIALKYDVSPATINRCVSKSYEMTL